MCGIAGAVGWTDESVLETALSRLRHRGPDESGTFFDRDANTMMGMRRLSIVDLAGGSQPMYNESGSVAVVFNGEIYNHRALREDLRAKGHSFETECDTEVLTHLWEEYGERMPEHLRGMFAFSVYDRDRDCVFLARDRLGIKPLYYAETDAGVAWASEVAGLVEMDVDRTVDPQAVYDFFALGYAPAPRTLFSAVRKVSPGTSLLVTDGGESVSERRYWQLRPGRSDGPHTATGASDRIRELLEQSVERRLMADVPLGAFLSGGLDSSAIVGLLADRVDDVRTFSVAFEGDAYDESDEAAFVADHFGTDHTTHTVDLSSLDALDVAVGQYGDPLGDPAVLPTLLLSERASEGLKVVLTGEGADELFAGYSFYRGVDSARRRVERIPNWAFSPVERVAKATPHPLGPYVEYLASFRSDHAHLSGRLRSFRRRPEQSLDVDPDVANDADIERIVSDAFAHADDGRVQRLSAFALSYPLADRLLYKVDHTTMAHSLEARVPFLDQQLVEFAHGLPDHLKRESGYKPLLNRAVADLLPDRTRTRAKSGFNVPVDRWFRRGHEAVERWLREEYVEAAPYLDADHVFDEWATHRRGDQAVGGYLWRCLTYVAWYHEFATD